MKKLMKLLIPIVIDILLVGIIIGEIFIAKSFAICTGIILVLNIALFVMCAVIGICIYILSKLIDCFILEDIVDGIEDNIYEKGKLE